MEITDFKTFIMRGIARNWLSDRSGPSRNLAYQPYGA